jgi:integration host factor subunit beta
MTKADLIKEVSRAMKMTRKESTVVVESIIEPIVTALRNGDKIEIPGFGTFQAPPPKPRVGRSPKTRALIDPTTEKVPDFKPGTVPNSASNSSAPAERNSPSQPDLPNKGGWLPRADRVPFRYAIQLILENGRRRSVKTLNISQSGMLVESVLPIKTGSRVRIRTTELPFLCIGASIRRCARQWLVYRISLEFDSLLSRLF